MTIARLCVPTWLFGLRRRRRAAPWPDASAPTLPPARAEAADVDDAGFALSRFGCLEVSEVDSSTFDEALRAWQDTVVDDDSPTPVGADSTAWAPTAPMPG